MQVLGEIPAAALEQDRSVIFALDSALRIIYCNAAWDAFASANGGGPDLRRPGPLGQRLLDFVHGPVAEYYEAAYRRALETGEPWRHVYECSSASTFRKFALQVLPMKRARTLLVVNSICVERPHEPARGKAREEEYLFTDGLVVMCSHCRRTKRTHGSEQWDWVPEYVEHLPPFTSHGLCGVCWAYYYPNRLPR